MFPSAPSSRSPHDIGGPSRVPFSLLIPSASHGVKKLIKFGEMETLVWVEMMGTAVVIMIIATVSMERMLVILSAVRVPVLERRKR